MRNFACGTCGSLVFFENSLCSNCGSEIGFHPELAEIVPLVDGRYVTKHGDWLRCGNLVWGCNWLVREDAGSGRCDSCRLTRARPASTDTLALEQLERAEFPKRRLLFQLNELRLPIIPFYETAGHGLAFDLLSTASGERVITGHLNGVVTLDLEEVEGPYREELRIALNEPYRTMLGHFRHEIGHYYWQLLVGAVDGADSAVGAVGAVGAATAGAAESPRTARLESFRALFGDERASYQDALKRHYSEGAPAGWEANFISQYATMHPWEDFAESFAHYLHIRDTLQTAAATGMEIDGSVTISALDDGLEQPRLDYTDVAFAEILHTWHVFTIAFNEINRSMGMNDVYPFLLSPAVATKLAWVHELVVQSRLPEHVSAPGA